MSTVIKTARKQFITRSTLQTRDIRTYFQPPAASWATGPAVRSLKRPVIPGTRFLLSIYFSMTRREFFRKRIHFKIVCSKLVQHQAKIIGHENCSCPHLIVDAFILPSC